MHSLLTNLADELLVQDITEPSAVLGSLSDDELHTFDDAVLEQYALALLIGAHENSDWSDGKLVIAGNRGPIHLLQAAFYAVKLEGTRHDAGDKLGFLIATVELALKRDDLGAEFKEYLRGLNLS